MGLNFEWNEPVHTAAVCVYPDRAQDAIDTLEINHARFISVASGLSIIIITLIKSFIN